MPAVDGVNYPGPWEIRVNYETTTTYAIRTHQLRMSVDVDSDPGPGEDFDQYTLISRAGLYYNAETWIDAFVALMKEIYRTDATIANAELWKYASGTYNAAYQSAYSIGVAGTKTAGAVSWGQAILTFRSQGGGNGRLNFMESIKPESNTKVYPTVDTDINAIFDLVSEYQSPVLARDGTYLFSPLNYLPGKNERLFKQDFRK